MMTGKLDPHQVVATICVENILKSLPSDLTKEVVAKYLDEDPNKVFLSRQDLFDALQEASLGEAIKLYEQYKSYLTDEQRDTFYTVFIRSLTKFDQDPSQMLAYIVLAIIDKGGRWINDLYELDCFSACFTFFALATSYDQIAKNIKQVIDQKPIKSLDEKLIDSLLSKYNMYASGMITLPDMFSEKVSILIQGGTMKWDS